MTTAAPQPRARSRAARRRSPPPRSGGPRGTLRILEQRVFRGPNYWSYEPAIKLLVDLGELEEWPSHKIPGFVEGLLDLLPGVGQHGCSLGRPGGFEQRLRDGTWLGRGRARRPPAPARRRHRGGARQDAQHRRAGALPRRLLLRRGERRDRGRPDGGAARQPPRRERGRLRLSDRAREPHPARRARGLRAVDPGAARRGQPAGHPVDSPQRPVAGAARPRRPPEADPGHHDQPDQLAGRRHRVRQEADQPTPPRDRRPGPPRRGCPQCR